MQRDLEELHRQASGHYLKGEFPEAMAAWRQVLELKPDDERGREGIRLCEQLEGTVEQDVTAAPEPPIESTPVTAAPTVLDSGPPIDEAAANELRHRIEELLQEARSLTERGDPDRALRTIDRVLILDEENEQALVLRDSLQAPEPGSDVHVDIEVDLPAPAVATETSFGEIDSPDEIENVATVQVAQPQPVAPPPLLSQEDAPPPVQAGDGAPEFETEELDDLLGADASTTTDTTPPTAASRFRMPPWIRDRRVMLGAGGVLTVAAVLVSLQMFQGGEPLAESLPSPAPAPAAIPAVAEAPVEPSAEPASAPSEVVANPDDLLREAEAAFEGENYSAAVIAYDRFLKQQPEHPGGTARMKLAAERYREQLEHRQRWDDAVAAFENANYAEALRMFYRLSNDEYDADIERIKVNGWYNLGLSALQAKDCSRAIGHFEEALTVDPTETGVLAALDLAELCRGPAVTTDIRRLNPRNLDY